MSEFSNWLDQSQQNQPVQPDADLQPEQKTQAAPITDFLNGAYQQRDTELSKTLEFARDKNPEVAARVFRQQGKTGLPAEVIERNLDQVEKLSAANDFDASEFRKNSPLVAEWLKDVNNATLAHDDIKSLEGIEWLLKAGKASYQQGAEQVQLGLLRHKQLTSNLSDSELTLIDSIKKNQVHDMGADGWFSESYIAAANQVAQLQPMITEGLKYASPAALTAGGMALLAGQAGPQAALPEEIITVPAAALIGATTGFTYGSAQHSFKVQSGLAYDEFKDYRDINGDLLDDDVARVAAYFTGAINAGLDFVALDQLGKTIPGVKNLVSKNSSALVKEALKNPTVMTAFKDFAVQYGTSLSAQTMINTAQELVQMVVGEFAKRSQGTFEELTAAEASERMTDAAKQALQAGMLLTLPGHGTQLTRDLYSAKQAKANREIMENLGETVSDSKLAARAPQKLRELVASMKEDSELKNVMIPVEQWNELFQSENLNPSEVAARVMGDDGAHYQEALATGADLIIPMEAYTEQLAGSQYHQRLLDDIRFESDQMTMREAAKWEAENPASIERAAAEIADSSLSADKTQFIFDDVVGQLKNTGMEAGTAETNATQMQAFFRTLSERTGIDAGQLWDRYKPVIKRELPDILKNNGDNFNIAIDPILDTIRNDSLPLEKDAYGPSMLDTLRELGINDVGGELAARDVDVKLKPFQKKIIRENGLGIDEAAQRMAEAGYLNEDIGRVTQNELFDAIDREMAGERIYSDQYKNPQLIENLEALQDIANYLDEVGIDVNTMTNQEIREVLLSQSETIPNGTEFDQKNRGRIRISDDKQFEITFFDKSDLSTLLHESGHMYLEIMQDVVARGEASESMRSDFQTVKDWLGVKRKLTTEQHEQFARSFEQYLREGKAPTSALQKAFSRFRAWLVSLYGDAKKLNANINDDVRGVFDRLLATDEEIKAAEQQLEYNRLFESADAAGMTAAEFTAYRKNAELAREEAQADILKKAYAEETREKRKWWSEAKQNMRAEVTQELAQNPTYQSLSYLQHGKLIDGDLPAGIEPVKLSRDALVDRYGKSFLRKLPRPYIYSMNGGTHPDLVASMFGFSSGDEMLQSIVQARPMKKLLDAEVETRMRERYGDMFTDGSLADKANESVHNERRAQVLAAEMQALGRRSSRSGKVAPAAMMKNAAESVINRKLVRDLKPNHYLTAERRAAKDAVDAVLRGDFDAALQAKQKQLLNFYLGNYARKVNSEIEKSRDYLGGFLKPKKREAMGKAGHDYLDQIDSLLEKAEFKKVSLKDLDRRKSLADFIAEATENGFDVDIPDKLIAMTQSINWRDMAVDDLIGLRDSVKNIEYLAKFKNKLLRRAEKRSFDETVNAITSSIEANNVLKPKEPRYYESRVDKIKDAINGAYSEHVKMEFLFERLDGDKEQGDAWNALFKPIADAETAELQMQTKYSAEIAKIFDRYDRKIVTKWHTEKHYIPNVGSMSKASAIAVALNWGNAGNQKAILDGHKGLNGKNWTETEVQRILELLDRKDWQTVQSIWDMINSLWPDVAKLQKDLTGLSPEKVDAMPVQTKYGEFRGGYYPLVYDTKHSNKAHQRDEKQNAAMLFQNNFAKPATKHGHTKERVGSAGQPVKLNLSVIHEHMAQVIHDLTHRRALMDVDRLIQNERVRHAIESATSIEMYRQIRPWLQSIAGEKFESQAFWEKIVNHVRMGATVTNMGYKFTTAFSQIAGFTGSIDEIGVKYGFKALQQVYGGGRESLARSSEFVLERSVMMQNRNKTYDRDVRDASMRMMKQGKLDGIRKSFFVLTGLMDQAVGIPTWLGAYQKALDGNVENIPRGHEQKAIEYADRTVRVTQSAGGVKDLARIQRGGPLMKTFTMFYSYFSVLFNQLDKRGRQWRNGQLNTPELIAHLAWLWFVPSLLNEVLAGRGPDDADDAPEWAAKNLALYPSLTVVGMRDIANGFGDFGYSVSPAFDALKSLTNTGGTAYKSLVGDDIERSDIKNAWMTTGYFLHLPARQTWITSEYIYDVLTGEDSPEDPFDFVRDLMFTRSKK